MLLFHAMRSFVVPEHNEVERKSSAATTSDVTAAKPVSAKAPSVPVAAAAKKTAPAPARELSKVPTFGSAVAAASPSAPAHAAKTAPAPSAKAADPAAGTSADAQPKNSAVPAPANGESVLPVAVALPGGKGEKSRRGHKLRRFLKSPWLLFLVLPTLLALLYFLVLASPMYVSHASFAVRSADASVSGGVDIASMFLRSSGSMGNDAYIINDYIQSIDLAENIDRELSLVAHYSSRDHDMISRLWQSPTQDELLRYWRWAVVPQLNVDTGIISLEVKAYTPDMAQKLTQAVLSRSEALVNAMNERARQDAVKLSREEVSRAEERVRRAQSVMREFRDAHNLIDPKMTAEGLQSLVSGLEAEATTLRTQISEAKSYMHADAPLLKSLRQRLAAVEKQLREEKLRVAGQGSVQDNINALVADYEDLTIEAEFAQKQLVSAMTSLEQARIQQMAQSRYVVAYQQPTLPDESLYPRPFLFTFYVFAGMLLFLGIVSLIWASIREHAGF